MRKFKDATGREWQVEIHVPAAKRVRAALGIELFKLTRDGLAPLGELLADPCKLVDVLFVLCVGERAAVAPGVPPPAAVSGEDFALAMAGDALERAADAFVESLFDFYPDRTAERLRALVAAGRKVTEKVAADLGAMLAAFDPAAEAAEVLGVPAPRAAVPAGPAAE